MFYVLRCSACGAEEEVQRSVAQRDDPLYCYCVDPEDASKGTLMKRLVGVDAFINIPRAFRSDPDIFTRGMDKTDIKAMVKKDEADYERGWDHKNPTRPKRAHERTKMGELSKQFRGARMVPSE